MSIKSNLILVFVALGLAATAQSAYAQLHENLFFRAGREQFDAEIQNMQRSQPPGLILTVSNEELRWQPIVSEAGSFSVWAPQGQLSDETEVVELASATLTFRVLSSQTSFGRFVVAYADMPANLDDSVLLSQLQETLVNRQDIPLVDTQAVSSETYSGTALRFEGEDTVVFARFFTGNQRVYVVGVEQSRADAESDSALGFLGSFQLINSPSP